ncbi:hypothetical protein L914_21043 [Phytophthora nicotianae]|uniref:Uncharacterized protein n=2 Tax=Phytophthora nicotianae TaxID=4792 RepID=V9DYH5_PHYNI|nr:hypothetical protein F443_21908 [Phytophthora nicotianae P1569]ETM31375.1 hypothetical protein L914_21043 [Phytophthora nicotianae]
MNPEQAFADSWIYWHRFGGMHSRIFSEAAHGFMAAIGIFRQC